MALPNDRCGGSLQVCRLRVARLDGAGVPDPAAGALYVTDSLITLNFTPVVTEGQDFEQLNGCGDVCVSFEDDDRFKRYDLEMTICKPDPELIDLLAGGDLITNGDGTIGYATPATGTAGAPNGASVEAWTKHIVDDDSDPDYPYWRFVFPKTRWRLGAQTLENGIMTVPLVGKGTENTNFFDGPANDHPDTTVSGRAMSYFLDTDIPAAVCGVQTLAAS